MTSKPHSDWIPYRYAGAGPHLPFDSGPRARPTSSIAEGAGQSRGRRAGVPSPWNSGPGAGRGPWAGARDSCTLPTWPNTRVAGWRLRAFLSQLWGALVDRTHLPCPLSPYLPGSLEGPVFPACAGLVGAGSALWPSGEGVRRAGPRPRPRHGSHATRAACAHPCICRRAPGGRPLVSSHT